MPTDSTELSQERLQDLKEAFECFDKDADGYLTHDELDSLLKHLGISPKRKDIQEFLLEISTDGEGHFEFHELINLIKMVDSN